MKANTAMIILLNAASLALSLSYMGAIRRHRPAPCWPRSAALLTTTVLIEVLFWISTGIDTLLAADRHSSTPGRMSPQTAGGFTLLSLLIATAPFRRSAPHGFPTWDPCPLLPGSDVPPDIASTAAPP